ncbi:hypothetical protein ACC811_37605, partial [Rhizobium ruizarguesonis]
MQAAIEYAAEHVDELPSIEILIRTGSRRYVILWGDQLAALITRVCVLRRRRRPSRLAIFRLNVLGMPCLDEER